MHTSRVLLQLSAARLASLSLSLSLSPPFASCCVGATHLPSVEANGLIQLIDYTLLRRLYHIRWTEGRACLVSFSLSVSLVYAISLPVSLSVRIGLSQRLVLRLFFYGSQPGGPPSSLARRHAQSQLVVPSQDPD